MSYTKYLRVLEKLGWTTKPVADLPENIVKPEEVDGNFLQLETQIEQVLVVSDEAPATTHSVWLDPDDETGGLFIYEEEEEP